MRVSYKRWREAEEALKLIIECAGLTHIDPSRVRVVVSDSRSTAVARIWGLQRVFQEAFNLPPLYVIEVVWGRFSRLDCADKIDTLVHELIHIPSSFSGGLRGHGRIFARAYREAARRFKERCLRRSIVDELCRLLSEVPKP